MFISDWKSIRCEEVQKNGGNIIFRSLNSKTPSPKTSERTPPTYSVTWGWVNISSREVRFHLWGEFLAALSEDQLLPISFTSGEPPKKIHSSSIGSSHYNLISCSPVHCHEHCLKVSTKLANHFICLLGIHPFPSINHKSKFPPGIFCASPIYLGVTSPSVVFRNCRSTACQAFDASDK